MTTPALAAIHSRETNYSGTSILRSSILLAKGDLNRHLTILPEQPFYSFSLLTIISDWTRVPLTESWPYYWSDHKPRLHCLNVKRKMSNAFIFHINIVRAFCLVLLSCCQYVIWYASDICDGCDCWRSWTQWYRSGAFAKLCVSHGHWGNSSGRKLMRSRDLHEWSMHPFSANCITKLNWYISGKT